MHPRRILVAAALCIGCAASCKPSRMTTETPPVKLEAAEVLNPATQQGLELMTILIPEQDGLDTLIEDNSQPIQSDDAGPRLASEAMLVRILREEDLASVFSTLEENGAAQNIWCGQMLEWRDLLEQRMNNRMMTLNEDLLLFKEGRLTIGARGWVEPSIEGVRTRVELVPRHLPDRPATPSLIRNNKIVPHWFEEASVQTELAPGEVLMITCTAPLPDPASGMIGDDGNVEGENAENDSIDEEKTAKEEPKRPIERLGHIMFVTPSLSSERRSLRTALLLIPRIPTGMLPREPDSAKRTQRNR